MQNTAYRLVFISLIGLSAAACGKDDEVTGAMPGPAFGDAGPNARPDTGMPMSPGMSGEVGVALDPFNAL